MRPHPLLLLATLALSSACQKKPRSYHDTEGRVISARCDLERNCELELLSGGHAPDKDALAFFAPGSLVAVCDVTRGKPPDAPSDCRALECKSDADCPPGHGLDHGTCIDDLCHEPTNGITTEDAVMLCLAGTGLGTTKPDRLAMGLNCGAPCKVPSVCRQP